METIALNILLDFALFLWITQEEIDNTVLPDPLPIVEEIELTPEQEFELFLIEINK